LLSLPLWLLTLTSTSKEIGADPIDPRLDTDGDFLPDVVEWACLTDPQNPDTDRDGIGDFIEVVQRGNPRRVGMPRPADHEMRIVVTATEGPNRDVQTNLHLLFRFLGTPSLLTSFQPWLRIGAFPGLEIPLGSLASGMTSLEQRIDPIEGLLVSVLIPMASESMLRALLPCTIGARATIGDRELATTVPLFDVRGTTATLVPFDQDGYAVQSIGAMTAFQGGSNRVCVVQLSRIGVGPGGVAYQVTHADCDDCNGLQCGVQCADLVSWVLVLPGGLGSIAGG
jgi:hypothetical protein